MHGTGREEHHAEQQAEAAEHGAHIDDAARVLWYNAHHHGHDEHTDGASERSGCPVQQQTGHAEGNAQADDDNGENCNAPRAHSGHTHAALQGTSCGDLEK